jgi:hypothetical protein
MTRESRTTSPVQRRPLLSDLASAYLSMREAEAREMVGSTITHPDGHRLRLRTSCHPTEMGLEVLSASANDNSDERMAIWPEDRNWVECVVRGVGDKPVSEVTLRDLSLFLHLRWDHRDLRQRNWDLEVIYRMFSLAVALGWRSTNPAQGLHFKPHFNLPPHGKG